MSIVEHASGLVVPNGQQFVTDALIDRIISTHCFTTHGDTTLYEWFEEAQSWDYMPATLKGMPFEQAVKTPEFRKLFHYWMHDLRAPYVTRELKLLAPQTTIVRAMLVTDEWLLGLLQPQQAPLPLGVFWTTGEAIPHGVSSEGHVGKREVYISTRVCDVVVDWKETFESRFDYQNGDMEEEIQLVRGSAIDNVSVEPGERYEADRILHDEDGAAVQNGVKLDVHPSLRFVA